MTQVDSTLLADMLRESMRSGERPILTVTSSSMRPLLAAGDQVRIAPVEVGQLQRGDIVTVRDPHDPGQLLTHRYWARLSDAQPPAIWTRGDRPALLDNPSAAADVLGRVTARRRGARELILDAGRGQRLNGYLGRLASAELSWLAGRATSAQLSRVEGDAINARVARQLGKLSVRSMRRALLIVETVLIMLMGLGAQRDNL